ncbi:anthranilate phosphoribosyltransferase [Buchnera aphidicola]|uniref:Anthranilate phosphoribosyltransferase n=1 Tax=Buchnera aphidicola (Sarucallis kahawaluokalani) TaxID=1241878 RepID=A0A4D6YJV6_9GAMM|nr:anthranilate phosphoribosyltransferase [Buchnera aphidicola]QCI25988.1 anthranilate phosphoribosyltransferase [Buchnera aphidicola (Sarucallis kahawaluokalani)]
MKKIFNKLYKLKTLNELESYKLFKKIIKKRISNISLTAVLTAIKVRSASINEIIGAIKAFQKYAKKFPHPNYFFSDIVGTGGDYSNTINISTASAILAASLGLKIIKHCNCGISSQLGSIDILKKNNINVNLNLKKNKKQLDNLNICFLYAPKYHSGFKNVVKVRKELSTRTIFNTLGPLLNPSRPNFTVIGVYHQNLLLPFAKIVHALNYERAIILHSDGMDEITLHGTTNIVEVNRGNITAYTLYPEDFGLCRISKDKFKNNTIQENCHYFKNISKGIGKIKYQYLIAMNTAILLKVFGYENLIVNTKIAFQKIQNGDISKHIKKISMREKICNKIY